MLAVMLVTLYNLFLIVGTTYLVNSGWSVWTFLLTALFLLDIKFK